MTREFENWEEGQAPYCAGAAKYRANIGADARLSPLVGRLPEDHENVFSSPSELIAHHKGISIEEAQTVLAHKPTAAMLMEELQRTTP